MEASAGRVDFSHKQLVRWGALRLRTPGGPVMEILSHTGREEDM